MRLIIVSREASREGGLYIGHAAKLIEHKERSKAAAELLWKNKDDGAIWGIINEVFKTLGVMAPIGTIFRAFHGKQIEDRMKALLEVAYQMGFNEAQNNNFIEHIKAKLEHTFGHEILKITEKPWAMEPFEQHCLTLSARDLLGLEASFKEVNSLLIGAIESEAQYNAILQADGGTSKIHIFNLETARHVLKRHGGGTIEEGCFILHPKRDNVLVPFKTYHMNMLQEMIKEARVVMGSLGAKQLSIIAESGVSFNGTIVSNVPLKSGQVAVDVSSEKHKQETFTWGSPTFTPEVALLDCVWIQDNAGIMTIVDQRRTSDLIKYEEYSEIDTTFKLSIELMKIFKNGFSWAEKSTYRYEVEFFNRPQV